MQAKRQTRCCSRRGCCQESALRDSCQRPLCVDRFIRSSKSRRQAAPQRRFRCWLLGNSCGQTTVEYLVVGTVLLIIFAVLGQLMGVVQEGSFVQHAGSSASHVATQAAMGVVGDVFLY